MTSEALDAALRAFNRELREWLAKGGDRRLLEFDPLRSWGDVVALLNQRERFALEDMDRVSRCPEAVPH